MNVERKTVFNNSVIDETHTQLLSSDLHLKIVSTCNDYAELKNCVENNLSTKPGHSS